jgi:hypothetical protein
MGNTFGSYKTCVRNIEHNRENTIADKFDLAENIFPGIVNLFSSFLKTSQEERGVEWQNQQNNAV